MKLAPYPCGSPTPVPNPGPPEDQPVSWVSLGTNSDGWHDGWATDQRFNLPNDVAPGAFIDLTVQVTAPNTAGSYVLRFRMLKKESPGSTISTRFRSLGSRPTLSYALAGITPAAGTPIPIPGSTWRLNLTVRNIGTETWNATGDGRVRLAIHFVADPDSDNPHERWVTDDRFELPRDVPPYVFDQTNGQIKFENLIIHIPRDAGSYTMHIRMVKEGVTWFEQNPNTKFSLIFSGLIPLLRCHQHSSVSGIDVHHRTRTNDLDVRYNRKHRH